MRQCLAQIASSYGDLEIQKSLKSKPAIIEPGEYAKLKGIVQNSSTSLHALVGMVLKKSFTLPPPLSSPGVWGPPGYTEHLHAHTECIWQIYMSLSECKSVGLPLLPSQTQQSEYLVTLCHGDKPVAEGHIIWPHPATIKAVDDDHGRSRQIRITRTHSLIKITRVLVPGSIHHPHSQCIQWIFDHGQQAVVVTSTLHSCSSTPPSVTSALSHALANPAPLPTHDPNPPFQLSIPADGISFSQVTDMDQDMDSISDSDEIEGDEHDVMANQV